MYVGDWTIKQLAQRIPKGDTICALTLTQKKGIPLATMYVFVSLLSPREILPFQQKMFQHSVFLKIFIYPHHLHELLHTPCLPFPALASLATQWIEIIPDSQTDKRSRERKIMSTIYSLQTCLRGCTVCFWGEEGRKTPAHVMSTLNSYAHTLRNAVRKKQETWGRNFIRGPQRQNYLKTEGLEKIKGQQKKW